jgi:hypothetical protein
MYSLCADLCATYQTSNMAYEGGLQGWIREIRACSPDRGDVIGDSLQCRIPSIGYVLLLGLCFLVALFEPGRAVLALAVIRYAYMQHVTEHGTHLFAKTK